MKQWNYVYPTNRIYLSTIQHIEFQTRSLPGSAKILRTIDYFGQPYALYKDGKTSEAKFGKINFEDENVFGEGAVDAAFSSSYDGFLFVW